MSSEHLMYIQVTYKGFPLNLKICSCPNLIYYIFQENIFIFIIYIYIFLCYIIIFYYIFQDIWTMQETCSFHVQTSKLFCTKNWFTGFYMIWTLPLTLSCIMLENGKNTLKILQCSDRKNFKVRSDIFHHYSWLNWLNQHVTFLMDKQTWKLFAFNPFIANSTKWLSTLKQFVGNSRRIVWVCLTILWGALKGSILLDS